MTILDVIAFGLKFTASAAAVLLLTAVLAVYAALVIGFWR